MVRSEDEFEKARQQMMRSDGRDFLEESTIAEAARQDREREVLKEARSGLVAEQWVTSFDVVRIGCKGRAGLR